MKNSQLQWATSADIDFFYDLYMHPNINPFLLYEPMTKTEFQPIFDDLQAKKQLFVFENAQNERVGMCKLVRLAHRTAHIAYIGGVAISPNFAGKGYGEAMFLAILDWGKTQGIKRLELSTATFNDRAIRLYERVGFVREGILKNYTHLVSENRFIDELLMSYIFE